MSDWRKNVEAMSGMEGRKKMFDAAKGPNQQTGVNKQTAGFHLMSIYHLPCIER